MKLFSDGEKRVLDTLSAKAVNRDEVLNTEAMHGFFFGLATIPDLVVPSEWLPVIFGEEMVIVENEGEANALFGPLFAIYSRFMREGRGGSLRFPFDVAGLARGDVARMGDWAYGFNRALLLSEEIWPPDDLDHLTEEELTEKDKELAAAFSVVIGVAMPEQIPEMFETTKSGPTPDKEDVELMAALFALLPDAVAMIRERGMSLTERSRASMNHAVSAAHPVGVKISRNDPCPCGSGKEFKRCCGMN